MTTGKLREMIDKANPLDQFKENWSLYQANVPKMVRLVMPQKEVAKMFFLRGVLLTVKFMAELMKEGQKEAKSEEEKKRLEEIAERNARILGDAKG